MTILQRRLHERINERGNRQQCFGNMYPDQYPHWTKAVTKQYRGRVAEIYRKVDQHRKTA